MSVSVLDEADVRRICREESARPTHVSQRTVETIVGGLSRRDYLRLARDGAFPVTKVRRLVIARTTDVMAYLEQRIALRDEKPSNDHDPEGIALAKVGARRVSQ